MLKVTIEFIPFGNELEKKTIAEINIIKTGKKNTSNETRYDYSGWHQDEGIDGKPGTVHKFSGRTEHWRPHPALLLVYKILYAQMQNWIKNLKWDY